MNIWQVPKYTSAKKHQRQKLLDLKSWIWFHLDFKKNAVGWHCCDTEKNELVVAQLF